MTAVIPQDRQGQTGPMRAMADLTGPCAVQLIDRRAGAPHRRDGRALTVLTHQPEQAAADLLRGRNPALWKARVDRLVAPRGRP